MLHRRLFPLVLICLSAIVRALGAEPPGFHAWFVDSLVKIFPSDLPGRHRLVIPELSAARNQHVSIQLAIRSAEPRQGIWAEVESLKGAGGEVITGATIHPVGYVVVGSHTKNTPEEELVGEAPGWYPDPLLDFPLEAKAGRTYSLWVTVPVPADCVPGLYRGTLVIRAEKRTLARANFRLRVHPAVVPRERSLKITNWFWLDDKVSRQFYGVPALSSEWWTLIENIARVMADHRQNVVLTPLMELIEPRPEGNRLTYNFANLDRWVETFQRAGVVGFIEGSHLLGRGASYNAPLEVATFQIESGKVSKQTLAPDDPRVVPFLTEFLSALNAHLEERGWKSIYFQHLLDEPHGSEPAYYGRFAELVHRLLSGIPTLDAIDAAQIPEEVERHCDIWVPQLGRFDDRMDLLRQRIQAGHEVWFYTCLFPNQRYLNRLIDYPLLKVRLLHWLNFRYGFSGYLHWGWSSWSPEPMNDTQPVINNNEELLPPGDAFIVYPDRARKSVFSSMRLEAMREGIEDYELLEKLRAKNPAEAERLCRTAISSFTDYVRNPATFRKIERDLVEALSK